MKATLEFVWFCLSCYGGASVRLITWRMQLMAGIVIGLMFTDYETSVEVTYMLPAYCLTENISVELLSVRRFLANG